MQSTLSIQPPAPALAPYVQHYWRSLANADAHHRVLPDGRVDVVLEVAGSRWRGWAYGSTTRPAAVECAAGAHYLGIRFRPGGSRHFLRAAAGDLTDRREDATPLSRFALDAIAEQVAHASVFAELDRRLAAVLQRAPSPSHPADLMVRRIEAAHGAIRIDWLAAQLGKSPRQLQRLFVETVGVTAKFFARVTRAGRAVQLIGADDGCASLADVAAQAGYADQSHMTRELESLTGTTPGRSRVVFLQDPAPADGEY